MREIARFRVRNLFSDGVTEIKSGRDIPANRHNIKVVKNAEWWSKAELYEYENGALYFAAVV